MMLKPDYSLNGLFIAACLFVLLMFSTLFAGCKTAPQGPDASLFPKASKDYNQGYHDGFKKGFNEGLTFNLMEQ